MRRGALAVKDFNTSKSTLSPWCECALLMRTLHVKSFPTSRSARHR